MFVSLAKVMMQWDRAFVGWASAYLLQISIPVSTTPEPRSAPAK